MRFVTRLLYGLLDILLLILAVRFLLKLFGANPATPFTRLFYGFTNPFVAPFAGIFPGGSVGGFILEWSTIVAMAVYALAVYIIVRLLWLTMAPSGRRTVIVDDREDVGE